MLQPKGDVIGSHFITRPKREMCLYHTQKQTRVMSSKYLYNVLFLREILASFFNRVLDSQQKCSLPLVKLGELVKIEQL